MLWLDNQLLVGPWDLFTHIYQDYFTGTGSRHCTGANEIILKNMSTSRTTYAKNKNNNKNKQKYIEAGTAYPWCIVSKRIVLFWVPFEWHEVLILQQMNKKQHIINQMVNATKCIS